MSDSTRPPLGDHAWTRARMVALVSGLLPEETEARVRTHLDDCGECRAIFAELASGREQPDPARPGEHIPSGLMARWERSALELKGFERRMVRRHLESCESCRADLVMLGFEPQLSELAAPAVRLDRAAQDPVPVRTRGQVIRPFRSFDGWRGWVFGGGAIAAAAAALTILLRVLPGPAPQLASRPEGPANGTPPVSSGTTTPAPTRPAPAPTGTHPSPPAPPTGKTPSNPDQGGYTPLASTPVRVDATLFAYSRGTNVTLPDLPVVEIPRATDRLAVHGLRIVTEAGPDAGVVIAMFGPRGQQMAREETTVGKLRSTPEVIFPMPGFSAGLPFEDFVIVLAVTPGGGSEPDSARYMIRLAPPAR